MMMNPTVIQSTIMDVPQMKKIPELHAAVVLPAAGCGARFGTSTPKQFVDVCGKPLICYTIEALHSISWVSQILVPIPSTWKEFVTKIKLKYGYPKVEFVDGRESRHHSIFVGLKALKCNDSDIVVVHDACRPFIEETFLGEVVYAAIKYGAAGAIRPLVSTVVKTTADGFMETSIPRCQYRESHTPQAFTFGLITNAYEVCSREDFENGTECLQLVQRYCDVSPKLIDGPEYLWKVTHKKDFTLMESIVRAKTACLERNGQNKRKFDPTDKNGDPTSTKRTCDLINVFVGGLSETTNEDQLIRFFHSHSLSPLDVRLVCRNDGRSAGFGYVHFETREESTRCLELSGQPLDGHLIRFNPADVNMTSGSRMGRMDGPNSKNNEVPTKLLRVKNLSIDTDTETFAAKFKGAKNVCIVKNHETGVSCGFGFVEYHDISAAIETRKKMQGKEIDGNNIDIVFARAGESFGSGGRGGSCGRGRGNRNTYTAAGK